MKPPVWPLHIDGARAVAVALCGDCHKQLAHLVVTGDDRRYLAAAAPSPSHPVVEATVDPVICVQCRCFGKDSSGLYFQEVRRWVLEERAGIGPADGGAPSACLEPLCPAVVRASDGWCDQHRPQALRTIRGGRRRSGGRAVRVWLSGGAVVAGPYFP